MLRWPVQSVILGALLLGAFAAYPQESSDHGAAIIETPHYLYEVGADGRNVALVDKATGTRLDSGDAESFVAVVEAEGERHTPSGVHFSDGLMRVDFGNADGSLSMRIRTQPGYVELVVTEMTVPGCARLELFNLTLAEPAQRPEDLAFCILSLNLTSNVEEYPGPSQRLKATCYEQYGFVGARLCLLGAPMRDMRREMQIAVASSDAIPASPLTGPWALDAPTNRGSYLFGITGVTTENAGRWIDLANAHGITQINLISAQRHGDLFPRPDLYPNGTEDLKQVIRSLHDAGILAALHSYAYFIDKTSSYVTPVPDRRLAKDASFTLREDISAGEGTVPTVESTSEMPTETGWLIPRGLTIQIDDELIVYSGITKEPPYAFTGCERGAYGTQAAAHEKGAQVHHLKEYFAHFLPDPDTALFDELAARIADTFNECDYDMIYFDALDGGFLLRGWENFWHESARFVYAVAERLNKPAVMEMSMLNHHLWFVRSRLGAWDHPIRGHRDFVRFHLKSNAEHATTFFPAHLGWWAPVVRDEAVMSDWIQIGSNIVGLQAEPTFPEDIEYLMSKCLATDSSYSLMGIEPDALEESPAIVRLANIHRTYEELRLSGAVSNAVKQRLQDPDAEFTLETDEEGKVHFREATYAKHRIEALEPWSNQWTVENPYEEQGLKIRLEVLNFVEPAAHASSATLEAFTEVGAFEAGETGAHVTGSFVGGDEPDPGGAATIRFTAENRGTGTSQSWISRKRSYQPVLNTMERPAFGVWVHGDGNGQLLALQLRSSTTNIAQGLGHYYMPIDFTGWRYFELVESEGERISDYPWPLDLATNIGHCFSAYRYWVDFRDIATLTLWYTALPPNVPVSCAIGEVRALPVVKGTIRNLQLTIGEQNLRLPMTVESGSYIECEESGHVTVYSPSGVKLNEFDVEGPLLRLAAGTNRLEFTCDVEGPYRPRVMATVHLAGARVPE